MVQWNKAGTINEKYKQHGFSIQTNNKNRQVNNDKYMTSTKYDFVSDVFCRVGGTQLWRADHDVFGSVYNGNKPVDAGFVIVTFGFKTVTQQKIK